MLVGPIDRRSRNSLSLSFLQRPDSEIADIPAVTREMARRAFRAACLPKPGALVERAGTGHRLHGLEIAAREAVFTGVLESGPRRKAQATVKQLGGLCPSNIRVDTDFLVVGSLGTDCWKTSRYGTKIEKVIRYRETSDATTQIVREVDFMRAAVATSDLS